MMDTAVKKPAVPMVPIADVISSLDEELAQLIRQYLGVRTRSISSYQEKVTGNAYQSVRLRDEILPGFRVSDEDIYAGMQMEGKTFIDMGCNLGERTRIASRNGAKFAEGVEYEELLVRIGALVSAYNRMHRILIRQGDITQPGTLTQDYDIGACFSAFTYVRQNLQEILSRIKRLFILETHALDNGWFGKNVTIVSKVMPHWIIYDLPDHGARLADGKRACIAFAREAHDVRDIAETRARVLEARNKNIALLDLANSPRVVEMCGEAARGSRPAFESLRAAMQAEERPSEANITGRLRDFVECLKANTAPEPEVGFGTDRYWIELFLGLIGRIKEGSVTSENSYLIYLRKLCAEGNYDPAMQATLADTSLAVERIGFRLNAMLRIFLARELSGAPTISYNAMSTAVAKENGLSADHLPSRNFIADALGNRYACRIIDGYHRHAALYLAGANTAPSMFVWTNGHGLILRKGTELLAKGAKPAPVAWEDPAAGKTLEGTVNLLFAQ